MLLEPQPTCLLIADLSGYTGYLADVELDHAHDILADLLNTVVTALRPTFRLAKLEGDAAFTVAFVDRPDGTTLLDTIERCYFGFRRRRRDVRQATSCECHACVRIPDLDLKFVVHHGQALVQKVAGRKELVGSDVILVHRLLKNEVADRFGIGAYALFTEACLAAAAIEPQPLGMLATTESFERIGEVSCWVHDLDRRWREEEARVRVFVRPEDAIIDVKVPTRVPPQVAWEFLTVPGRRRTWQPGMTDFVVTGATGGRRGTGATNHCVHGDDVTLEEILDWRPYDYLTDRTIVQTPGGPLRLVHTLELEPTAEGTIIHFRYGPPKAARERAMALQVAPMFDGLIRQAADNLLAAIESDAVGRTGDDLSEPELARPRSDGPLSGLAPITMLD
ncbi:MAG TPA: DUF2652 domain-containing protein [Candidatus Limnocylindrales bacterium]